MSLSAGPLALSLNVVLLFLAFFTAVLVGWLLGRRRNVAVEPALSSMLFLGVLGARVGFVLLYLEDYLEQPLSILDIRDGGFFLPAGLAVALVVGLFYAWRRPTLRVPLGVASVVGAGTWAATAGIIGVMYTTQANLPALTFTTLDGEKTSLEPFEGRPMVINLWATWCPPCRREMPVLADAQQSEKDIVFLFINQGEGPNTINQYLEEEQLGLDNILLDQQSYTMRQLGANGLPSTYFFNSDGELVDTHFGALSSASLKSNLRSIKP
ncbi:TlpA disulfide reductase family protein [Marinimicrobium locisalis]|uniref:TlpA disulfide reductase family protein n=1 Tax=Marinimicrobium locisalis TaxID=546022 RepID=UPI003221E0D3